MSPLGDLGSDVLGEQVASDLNENLVLADNIVFLDLVDDVGVAGVPVLGEPGSKSGIRRVAILFIVVVSVDGKGRKLLGDFLRLIGVVKDRVSTSTKSIVNVGTLGGDTHVGSLGRTGLAILLGVDDHRSSDIGLGRHSLLSLGPLLGRRVLENVGREFVLHVNLGGSTTSFAISVNGLVSAFASDDQLGLGVVARATKDKLDDKGIEEFE